MPNCCSAAWPDEKHKRYVQAILGASERAAKTTQQLLAFSRKQMLRPQVVDLNEAIANTVELLQRVIGEDVELSLVLSPDAGKVMVDPAQFGQILMNLGGEFAGMRCLTAAS